jgi:hypothetical protein
MVDVYGFEGGKIKKYARRYDYAGSWVKVEDYRKLQDENTRLRDELVECQSSVGWSRLMSLEGRIMQLEDELEKATGH